MFRREPITRSTSLFCTVKFPARSPTVPGRPPNSGKSLAIASIAVQAGTTGTPSVSTTSSRSSVACESRIPEPIMTTGRFAAASRSTISINAASSLVSGRFAGSRTPLRLSPLRGRGGVLGMPRSPRSELLRRGTIADDGTGVITPAPAQADNPATPWNDVTGLNPDGTPAVDPNAPKKSLDEVLATALAREPGDVPAFMSFDEDRPVVNVTSRPAAGPATAFHFQPIDQTTGEAAPPVAGHPLLEFLLQLHTDMFLGLPGMLFLGAMGLLLVAAIVSEIGRAHV